jgi:ribosomal protein S21|tara:strand:+ start:477 stop:701 length:225 start_codon:yes stop_codon:yes gene_type:complete
MKKAVNVSVKDNPRKPMHPEALIRSFIKKVKKEKIIEQARDRMFYLKPSEKKRLKRERAQRTRRKEELKRLKGK